MITGRDRFLTQQGISREIATRFDRYAALLTLWNKKINLVSPSTIPDLWTRHFLDSAQLLELLPPGRLVDLGAGAGFPGLVLALLGRTDVHLIESDQRKSVFLREVARETNTSVTIHAKRIEEIPTLNADVVTARALAPLDRLVPWAYHHLKPGGQMVFPKGAELDKEILALEADWTFEATRTPSLTSPDAAMVCLSAISPKGDKP